MICPLSRTLFVAAAVGLVASTVWGTDLAGWLAAIVVGLVLHLVQRRRPAARACALEVDRRPAGSARSARGDAAEVAP